MAVRQDSLLSSLIVDLTTPRSYLKLHLLFFFLFDISFHHLLFVLFMYISPRERELEEP